MKNLIIFMLLSLYTACFGGEAVSVVDHYIEFPNNDGLFSKNSSIKNDDIIDAYNALVKLSKTERGMFFDRKPVFLVDSIWLCFTMPNKNSFPLEGYYVNTKTKSIQYWESDKVITKKVNRVSHEVFTSKKTLEH